MSTTTKYGFEEIDYSTSGWNALLTTNMQKLDDLLQTYLRYPIAAGATDVDEGLPVCIHNSEFKLAKADGVHQPAVGVIKAGESCSPGNNVLAIRAGECDITGASFNPTSGEIWYDASGALTQTEPGSNSQKLGVVVDSNTILVQL